jgi:hypothetical protein
MGNPYLSSDLSAQPRLATPSVKLHSEVANDPRKLISFVVHLRKPSLAHHQCYVLIGHVLRLVKDATHHVGLLLVLTRDHASNGHARDGRQTQHAELNDAGGHGHKELTLIENQAWAQGKDHAHVERQVRLRNSSGIKNSAQLFMLPRKATAEETNLVAL